jgi:hypothetical protein
MKYTAKRKKKLWSHDTSYYLIEVVAKAGLTVHKNIMMYNNLLG